MTAMWFLVILVASTQIRQVDSLPPLLGSTGEPNLGSQDESGATADVEEPAEDRGVSETQIYLTLDGEQPAESEKVDGETTTADEEEPAEDEKVEDESTPDVEEPAKDEKIEDGKTADDEEPADGEKVDHEITANDEEPAEDEKVEDESTADDEEPADGETVDDGKTAEDEEPAEGEQVKMRSPGVEPAEGRHVNDSSIKLTSAGEETARAGQDDDETTTDVEEPAEIGHVNDSSVQMKSAGRKLARDGHLAGLSSDREPNVMFYGALLQALKKLHEIVVGIHKDVSDIKKNASVIPDVHGDLYKIQGKVSAIMRQLQQPDAFCCKSKACSFTKLNT